MQAHELLKQLRIPELSEVRDYFHSLSTNTLLGMGAFTAVTAYWFATRPKALKAPCDLRMQSVELPVRQYYIKMNSKPVLLQSENIKYGFCRSGWRICSSRGGFKWRTALEPFLRGRQDLIRVVSQGSEGVKYVLFTYISTLKQ